MNNEAVAFSLTQTEGQFELNSKGKPEPDSGGQFEPDSGGQINYAIPPSTNKIVAMFPSSEECRKALQEKPTALPVIVCNDVGTITPINLAAALCSDSPERDVYLMEEYPTESLALRARAAGIRGILSRSQARRLLEIDQELPERKLALPPIEATKQTAATIQAVAMPQLDHLPQAQAQAQVAAPYPISTDRGRIVGFLSGRGGVGKSTVALMTALLAQSRGIRVALVDLDLQFGDLDYLAGKEPSSKIQRLALEQSCADIHRFTLSDEALTLVFPPKHPEQGERFVADVPALLFGLAAQRDLVVINTGSFWTEIHAHTAQCCDHLAFLMDQRATSIEACKQVVDLCIRMQMPQARFIYLLNGCGRHAALTPLDVTLALGGAEVLGLADGGSLVDELLALGCPMELLISSNAFIASLEPLLDCLVHKRETPAVAQSYANPSSSRAKRFDLSALRSLFGGAHRVAT